MKRFLILALSLALAGLSFSQEGIQDNNSMEAMAGKPPRDPAGLEIFRRAYPDVFFNAIYQRELMDWANCLPSALEHRLKNNSRLQRSRKSHR